MHWLILDVIPDELPGRSGAIQAAINLEIPRDKIQYVNIKIEGLNGQLPNLDLFNLAVRLCRREQVLVTFHHRVCILYHYSATYKFDIYNIIVGGRVGNQRLLCVE